MSFYGNIINTPSSFQKIGVGNSGVLAAENLGNTIHFVGDNKHIRSFINNDEIKIEHINSSNINHNYQVQPANQIITGENQPITLSQITALNIDEVGHVNLLTMKNYNIELVGKKYKENNIYKGEIFNNYNKNVALGPLSHAEGDTTQAEGALYSSHSEGGYTLAKTNGAHAEGIYSKAWGRYAHAEGQGGIAAGTASHGEGLAGQSIGNYSHAEGIASMAIGSGSHSEGCSETNQLIASIELPANFLTEDTVKISLDNAKDNNGNSINGSEIINKLESKYCIWKLDTADRYQYGEINLEDNSLKCGYSFYGDNSPTAKQGEFFALYPFTHNFDPTISYTIKIYKPILALGTGSHSEGRATLAKGDYSHSGGRNSKALGTCSLAHGLNVITEIPYSTAFGKFNEINNNALFQIGYGSSDEERKDIFRVLNTGLVQIPTNGIQAQDVIATKNNVKLSEMPIQVKDYDTYFTIQQGSSAPISIIKPYNAMVNNAEIIEGSTIRLHVNGPNNEEIQLDIPLAEVLIDAQVADTETIALRVAQTGEQDEGCIKGYIKNNSISSAHIKDNSIENKHISGGITAEKIKSVNATSIQGDLPTSQLSGLITNQQLEGNITSDKLENLIITSDKLADDSVTPEKLSIAYLTKLNPVGNGSLSLNRQENSQIGDYSSVLGHNNIASALSAHAEGQSNTASGPFCHVEGYGNEASASSAHAEGAYNLVSNAFAHVEGSHNISSGYNSHAEGYYTIAKGKDQHVEGRGNIEDNENQYAHIIGNGIITDDIINRSNAYTLDWAGNAWYAGAVETESIILRSTTPGSTKKFKLTINDEAILNLEEVEETN